MRTVLLAFAAIVAVFVVAEILNAVWRALRDGYRRGRAQGHIDQAQRDVRALQPKVARVCALDAEAEGRRHLRPAPRTRTDL